MTFKIEGNATRDYKIIVCQSILFLLSGHEGKNSFHEMPFILIKLFSHLKVTSKNVSVAFLLPLGVCKRGRFNKVHKLHVNDIFNALPSILMS